MGRDNLRAIARTEATLAVKPEDSLEDRLRAAMKATYRHWMVTDENEQFNAAIEAVYLSASDDEKQRVEAEMRSVNTLGALLSGVPIDPDGIDTLGDPIGVIKLWHEVTGV